MSLLTLAPQEKDLFKIVAVLRQAVEAIEGNLTSIASLTTSVATIPATTAATWTPAITFTTPGDLNVVYSVQVADYVKIGRLVMARFQVTTSTFTFTTASGSLTMTGLPFTVDATTAVAQRGPLQWGGITKAGYTNIVVAAEVSTTTATFRASGSGVALSTVVAADTPSAGTLDLRGFLIYFTA